MEDEEFAKLTEELAKLENVKAPSSSNLPKVNKPKEESFGEQLIIEHVDHLDLDD
jgi:hypothetical protein